MLDKVIQQMMTLVFKHSFFAASSTTLKIEVTLNFDEIQNQTV